MSKLELSIWKEGEVGFSAAKKRMKLVAALSIVAFIVCCCEVIMTTNIVVASNRGLPFHINRRSLEQSAEYISITGCSNNCEIACCYCEIRQQPPLCLQCCKERN